jgi:hypothetical protein
MREGNMYVGVERGYDRPRKSWYRKDVPHSYKMRVCQCLRTYSRGLNKRESINYPEGQRENVCADWANPKAARVFGQCLHMWQ